MAAVFFFAHAARLGVANASATFTILQIEIARPASYQILSDRYRHRVRSNRPHESEAKYGLKAKLTGAENSRL